MDSGAVAALSQGGESRRRAISGDNPGYKPVDISSACANRPSRNAATVLIAARRVSADQEILAPSAVERAAEARGRGPDHLAVVRHIHPVAGAADVGKDAGPEPAFLAHP